MGGGKFHQGHAGGPAIVGDDVDTAGRGVGWEGRGWDGRRECSVTMNEGEGRAAWAACGEANLTRATPVGRPLLALMRTLQGGEGEEEGSR